MGVKSFIVQTLELPSKNSLQICNNQHIIVINFLQDFVASMLGHFFQGLTNKSLIYWPNHTTWGLYHKMYCGRNLRISAIS
jgi:hypothetical protein